MSTWYGENDSNGSALLLVNIVTIQQLKQYGNARSIDGAHKKKHGAVLLGMNTVVVVVGGSTRKLGSAATNSPAWCMEGGQGAQRTCG